MKKDRSPCHSLRLPAAVIRCAVRWHHRFNLILSGIEGVAQAWRDGQQQDDAYLARPGRGAVCASCESLAQQAGRDVAP